MWGLRVFGKNEGGLNHSGDFKLLFKPVLPKLTKMAIYAPGGERDAFGFPVEITSDSEKLEYYEKCIDKLNMCLDEDNEYGAFYFKPGFMQKFASFIRDDWNTIVCFDTPFPEFRDLFKAEYGHYPKEKGGYSTKNYKTYEKQQKKAWLNTGFKFYFQNIDARYWEVFSESKNNIRALIEYYNNKKIEFLRMNFEGGIIDSKPVKRDYNNIEVIWKPEKSKRINKKC